MGVKRVISVTAGCVLAICATRVAADRPGDSGGLGVGTHAPREWPRTTVKPGGIDIRIKNIRLESPPPSAPSPSAVLKFDMVNDGSAPVTDVVVEIAFLEARSTTNDVLPRVIVGPFIIRGTTVIDAGYTLNFAVLLRNLSVECNCVASVDVVTARAASVSAGTQ